MTDAMKSFLEQLATNEELQNNLQACKSPEEAFAVAQGAVEGLNFEEFTSTMQKVQEALTKTQGELADDDLEQVAGGWSEGDTKDVVIATVTSGGPAAASAV